VHGLGCSAFARHYWRNRFFSSGYLDVSVPRVPSAQTMYSSASDQSSSGRVSPFGHHRLVACTRLPDAFRSVPRPSSALDARASPVRLLSLRSVMRRPRSSLLSNGQWAISNELKATACRSATFDVRLLSRTLTRFLVIECSCHNPRGLRSFTGASVRVLDAASTTRHRSVSRTTRCAFSFAIHLLTCSC
jgi:hypothetical protein